MKNLFTTNVVFINIFGDIPSIYVKGIGELKSKELESIYQGISCSKNIDVHQIEGAMNALAQSVFGMLSYSFLKPIAYIILPTDERVINPSDEISIASCFLQKTRFSNSFREVYFLSEFVTAMIGSKAETNEVDMDGNNIRNVCIYVKPKVTLVGISYIGDVYYKTCLHMGYEDYKENHLDSEIKHFLSHKLDVPKEILDANINKTIKQKYINDWNAKPINKIYLSSPINIFKNSTEEYFQREIVFLENDHKVIIKGIELMLSQI